MKGEIALGVMGCPNWKNYPLSVENNKNSKIVASEGGIIMVAHAGCGTWKKKFSPVIGNYRGTLDIWQRCFVDNSSLVHEARFCIPDSQSWEFMPLSALFSSTIDDAECRDEKVVLLMPTCCGRFVLFLNLMLLLLLLSFACKQIISFRCIATSFFYISACCHLHGYQCFCMLVCYIFDFLCYC